MQTMIVNTIIINTEAPVKTPTRTTPATDPDTRKRYEPDRDHCPGQRVRTTRRIRRIIEP